MSKMSILGGQTRRKSSMLVMTPASSTHRRLQRSARMRYTEISPVQLMSPRPAVCHDQSGYAWKFESISRLRTKYLGVEDEIMVSLGWNYLYSAIFASIRTTHCKHEDPTVVQQQQTSCKRWYFRADTTT